MSVAGLPGPLDAAGFAEITGVSRETGARLEAYAALLAKWQRRINLVGPKTLPDLWRRHMLDSAQLAPLIPQGARVLADLGSGAGFPGLVLAAMVDETPLERVHLIESDQRKAAFLREAARVMGLGDRVTIHARRIEQAGPLPADLVTARALAPVKDLLGMARAVTGATPHCLFLKGRRLEEELTDAKSIWYIKYRIRPSGVLSDADPSTQTADRGAILEIEDFTDVRQDSGNHDPPEA